MKKQKLSTLVCIGAISLAVVMAGCGGGGGSNSGGGTGGGSTVKLGTFKFSVVNGASTSTYTSSDLNGVAGFTPINNDEQIILSEGDVLTGTDHAIYISVPPAAGTYSLGSASASSIGYITQSQSDNFSSARLSSPGSVTISQVSSSSVTGSFSTAVSDGTTTVTVSGTFNAALDGASAETTGASRFKSLQVHDFQVAPAS